MTKRRFSNESKEEAIKQIIDRGYTIGDGAKRIGISVQSLDKWAKGYRLDTTDRYEAELKEVRRENLTLKAELRPAQEERNIKKDHVLRENLA
mgnify:CR=1 FL=1